MWGGDGGNCVATALIEIKEESNEKNKDERDEKGKQTKGGWEWGKHQTPGEPVWLTGSKVVNPLKGDKSKKGGQVSQYG